MDGGLELAGELDEREPGDREAALLAVQRVVDDMRGDGLVQLEPNPHHRRAMLVAMTEPGRAAYDQAIARQEIWADDLAAGLPPEAIEAAVALLRTLQQRLDASAARTPSTVASTTRTAACS